MQGEMFDNCRVRKSLWDGPFGLSYGYQNISGAYQFPAGSSGASPPYAMVVNPGSTAQTVTMYTPSPSAGVMWCHELINMGITTGTITVKGASTGNPTIGTIAAGKRAELVWNPQAVPPEWTVFLSA